MEVLSIVTLSLSSLLLMMVGGLRLTNPIKNFEKNSGIIIPKEVDLLNEIRGVSGVMLMGGILILLGIFFYSFTFTSHVIASVLFLGFMLGRFVSIQVDGRPNKQIVSGIMFEIVLGGLNAFCVMNILL